MQQIISNIHYAPRTWTMNSHSTDVYAEFSQLFQLKAHYLIEELLSPLLTPFILYFQWAISHFSHFSYSIIFSAFDIVVLKLSCFFIKIRVSWQIFFIWYKLLFHVDYFSVNIEGLGDICSFAQMDISRDGDPRFASLNQSTFGRTLEQ